MIELFISFLLYINIYSAVSAQTISVFILGFKLNYLVNEDLNQNFTRDTAIFEPYPVA